MESRLCKPEKCRTSYKKYKLKNNFLRLFKVAALHRRFYTVLQTQSTPDRKVLHFFIFLTNNFPHETREKGDGQRGRVQVAISHQFCWGGGRGGDVTRVEEVDGVKEDGEYPLHRQAGPRIPSPFKGTVA